MWCFWSFVVLLNCSNYVAWNNSLAIAHSISYYGSTYVAQHAEDCFFYKPCVANKLLLLTSQWHVVLLVISAHNKLPSKATQQSSYPCTRRRLYPTSHTLRNNCSCLLHHNGMWRGVLMLLVTSSIRKLPSHTANCALQLDQLKN